jgi:ABC-type glutathione transport system ATPase component
LFDAERSGLFASGGAPPDALIIEQDVPERTQCSTATPASSLQQEESHEEMLMMVTVATPTGSAIGVRDVVKNYELAAGSFIALRRVNLQIADGEFVAVVSESGSGKTTLAPAWVSRLTVREALAYL